MRLYLWHFGMKMWFAIQRFQQKSHSSQQIESLIKQQRVGIRLWKEAFKVFLIKSLLLFRKVANHLHAFQSLVVISVCCSRDCSIGRATWGQCGKSASLVKQLTAAPAVRPAWNQTLSDILSRVTNKPLAKFPRCHVRGSVTSLPVHVLTEDGELSPPWPAQGAVLCPLFLCFVTKGERLKARSVEMTSRSHTAL